MGTAPVKVLHSIVYLVWVFTQHARTSYIDNVVLVIVVIVVVIEVVAVAVVVIGVAATAHKKE